MSLGERYILEQDQLFKKLEESSEENPDQLDFDAAIKLMEEAAPSYLHLPY